MKIITLSLFFCFLASGLIAQEHEKHMFDIRAYGGVSILQLTSDDNTSLIDGVLHKRSVSGRPGFQFGVAMSFGNRFYIQPGVQYSILSTDVVNENTVSGEAITDITTLSVISVPLKFGLRFIDPKKENIFNVRLFGGIDGHHILNVKHSTKSGRIDDIAADDYSNLIVNADMGLGLDLWIFYIDLGYQLGLTPVHSRGDKAKANSFYGNLGLRFTFGKNK